MSGVATTRPWPAIADLGRQLRAGEVTAVQLAQAALDRIARLDGALHAFLQVHAEAALRAARAADALAASGQWLGPLHGIPVALKDNVDLRGWPSTAGSTLRSDAIATGNAWIAQRLLECGAVIVGKTHMVELALGAWGVNEFQGTPRNPWGRPGQPLTPGGSSSGSAVAVAGGLVPMAVGTDTGASVRVPASFCGVTGFKPTIGALPGDGVVPLSTTLDSVGLITRTAADAALCFATLTQQPLEAATPQALCGCRIGTLPERELDGAQPEVLGAYRRLLDTLQTHGAQLFPLALSTSLDDLADVASNIMLPEAAASWAHLAGDDSLRMDGSVRPRILAGTRTSAMVYVNALRRREVLKAEFRAAFGQLDAFVTPTAPCTAQPVDEADHGRPPVRYARIGNLLDLCGISVPAGLDDAGRPIGMQIAANTGGDAAVLRIAQALQAVTAWHEAAWDERRFLGAA